MTLPPVEKIAARARRHAVVRASAKGLEHRVFPRENARFRGASRPAVTLFRFGLGGREIVS
jgi:hypothetical protein